jgi:hypothetical protein
MGMMREGRRLLLVVLASVCFAAGVQSASSEPCNDIKQARKLYPNKHLYRSGNCWSAERRKRPRPTLYKPEPKSEPVQRKSEPERPKPVRVHPNLDKPFQVIQPWVPVPEKKLPMFVPWDERVAPIYPGGK